MIKMLKKLSEKVKLLVSSGLQGLKSFYKENKQSLYKFLGKTFITIVKIIVEKILDKWM